MGLSLIVAGSAGGGGATELYTFGLYQRTTIGTPLNLWASVAGNAGGVSFSTLRRQGLQAGYSVTALKTLILSRALFYRGVAGASFGFGYSDSDRGLDNVADGANPVNLDTPTANGGGIFSAATAAVVYDLSVYYEIPAGKFPRIVLPTGLVNGVLQFFGHEV